MSPEISQRPRLADGGLLVVGLLLGVLMLSAATGQAQPRSFRLEGLAGGALQAEDLGRGAVVVVVWASWSPRCRDIVERVNALHDRWGDRSRLIMVSFQEDRSAVESFLAGKRAKAPVFIDRDGEFSKNHAVTTLPSLLVFRDGVTRFSGKLPANPDAVISQALGS